jgi:glycosyltransferase involved in cell wall biosynthesis
MRILFVSNGFPPTAVGGVEVYTYEIARALRDRSHDVFVFCRESNWNVDDYALLFDAVDDIPVIRVVNDFKVSKSFECTYTDTRIEQIFEEQLKLIKPDIVHFQHLIALSARLPAIVRRYRRPVVMTLHDFWPLCHRVQLVNRHGRCCPGPLRGGDCVDCVFGSPKPLGPVWRAIRALRAHIPGFIANRLGRAHGGAAILPWPVAGHQTFALRLERFRCALGAANRLLVPSQFVRDIFQQNGFEHFDFQVLPLGTDYIPRLRTRKHCSPRQLRLGYIGWFQPAKGADIVIKAFRQLQAQDITLHMFGTLHQRHSYARYVRALARSDPRIYIHGPFQPKDRPTVYQQIDILVLASIFPETFSKVAREALAYGIPVIAPRIGALPEVVMNGVNGFTFEPGNVDQLYEILLKIVQQPSILADLSIPGPIEIPTLQEHVDRLEFIYGRLTLG